MDSALWILIDSLYRNLSLQVPIRQDRNQFVCTRYRIDTICSEIQTRKSNLFKADMQIYYMHYSFLLKIHLIGKFLISHHSSIVCRTSFSFERCQLKVNGKTICFREAYISIDETKPKLLLCIYYLHVIIMDLFKNLNSCIEVISTFFTTIKKYVMIYKNGMEGY